MKLKNIITGTYVNRTQLAAGFLFLLCLFSFSCQKFVDKKPSSQILLIETAADCQLFLNNYNSFNREYPSDGEASSDNYYLSDSKVNDLANNNIDDKNIYTWSATAIRDLASPQWQSPYRIVYLANLALENAEKVKGTASQAVIDDLKGQALFFRAYAFWQVAQLYARPYSSATAGQDLGIPLRLSSDINGKSVRGTLQQTYAQITADLQQAANLLSSTLVVASRPNKKAAYAMLARVYLSMEDYTQAQNSANLALQNSQLINYNDLDVNSATPFVRFNAEVIFQSVTTSTPMLEPGFGSGTSNAMINPELIALYQNNDLRKQIFFKQNTDSSVPNGTYRFTGNYEPAASSTLFNGLAVDEIYLIRAECYARTGNANNAMADLNALLVTRWKKDGDGNTTYVNMTAANADDALAKVLLERRKELVFRGQRWTDLRRLNKDSRFAVTLSRTVLGTTYTLPPNDPRYTLLIPQEVIDKGSLQQNSR